jgi:hypothetical protein
MVKEDKGCNIGVERFEMAEVTNPRVHHSSLDEDLDVALSSLISLIVLDLGGPSSHFSMDAFNTRGFRIDVWVIAHRMGNWMFKESAVMVEVPVHVGSKSPEVVDAIDVVVCGFQKDWGDGIRATEEIYVGGLSINGEEERLGCCKG